VDRCCVENYFGRFVLRFDAKGMGKGGEGGVLYGLLCDVFFDTNDCHFLCVSWLLKLITLL